MRKYFPKKQKFNATEYHKQQQQTTTTNKQIQNRFGVDVFGFFEKFFGIVCVSRIYIYKKKTCTRKKKFSIKIQWYGITE
mgnify:CR=1 FL=1